MYFNEGKSYNIYYILGTIPLYEFYKKKLAVPLDFVIRKKIIHLIWLKFCSILGVREFKT